MSKRDGAQKLLSECLSECERYHQYILEKLKKRDGDSYDYESNPEIGRKVLAIRKLIDFLREDSKKTRESFLEILQETIATEVQQPQNPSEASAAIESHMQEAHIPEQNEAKVAPFTVQTALSAHRHSRPLRVLAAWGLSLLAFFIPGFVIGLIVRAARDHRGLFYSGVAGAAIVKKVERLAREFPKKDFLISPEPEQQPLVELQSNQKVAIVSELRSPVLPERKATLVPLESLIINQAEETVQLKAPREVVKVSNVSRDLVLSERKATLIPLESLDISQSEEDEFATPVSDKHSFFRQLDRVSTLDVSREEDGFGTPSTPMSDNESNFATPLSGSSAERKEDKFNTPMSSSEPSFATPLSAPSVGREEDKFDTPMSSGEPSFATPFSASGTEPQQEGEFAADGENVTIRPAHQYRPSTLTIEEVGTPPKQQVARTLFFDHEKENRLELEKENCLNKVVLLPSSSSERVLRITSG